MAEFKGKPTVVLVHGAWADGSSWNDVTGPLLGKGLNVLAAPIPMTSLSDDVAALDRVLERTDGPLVLTAHAYAGAVIAAPTNERVRALVYIAALAPEEGETVAEVFYREKPHPQAPQLAPDAHGFIWMPREAFAAAFAQHASPERAALFAATQRPLALACIQEKAPRPAWRLKPSWYLIAAEDRMINPATQRFMAARMGARVRMEKVDHTPMATAPQPVIAVILDAVASLTGSQREAAHTLGEAKMTNTISAAFPYQKQRRRVLGREMAYVEVGQGDPIVLLHGNPTSSYLWRNVLPLLQPLGRCIAPDLIGMADSDKLPDSGPGSYRFVEHRRYLDALLEALDVRERVTLVIHDWGSALGFDWANRHREAVKGIAFMESIVAPQGRDHWDKMGMRSALEALRSEPGEAMVLQNNYFIEEILPNAILRKLSDEEMAEYRRPFAEPGEGRRPTLTWPRQIPIAGEPADVHAIATEYANWLGTNNVPKLFLKAEPGAILANDTLINLVRGWPALTEMTVAGIHFVQEDSPDEIGRTIADWMLKL